MQTKGLSDVGIPSFSILIGRARGRRLALPRSWLYWNSSLACGVLGRAPLPLEMSVQDGPEMHLNARPKILVPVLLLLAIGGAFGAWKAGLLKSFTTGGSGKTSSAYFEDITAESGVAFQQWCGDSGAYFFPEIMGSGLALFDYDRDGDLDLYIVQAMPRKAAADRKPIGGRQPSPTSRLFRQGSDGRFTDVTEEAGLVDHEAYGVGVAAGDVNNDGWPD